MDLLSQLQQLLGADYQLERELGGGGMSRVFLANETRLGRPVVVKVLKPDLAAGISAERFEREIGFAARLQDPRIVPLLNAGTVGDLSFYTMPYIEGESLRARLSRARVPLDEALAILRDLALALEYAHARNVIHRDIKPENILLAGRTAVVTDFGIARAIDDASHTKADQTLTAQGTMLGTPAYMAPEQAAGEHVDRRADIYAWGVVAYELLSGTHPFASHTTAHAVIAAHISETPVPLAERQPGLPPSMGVFVDQCLAKDPAERPADASAIVAAVDAVVKRAAAGRRFAPAQFVVAGIGLALIVGFGSWLYVRGGRQRWAREQAIPESEQLAGANRSLAAYLVLDKAARYAPGDSEIVHALAAAAQTVSISSSPPGASIDIQDYLTPDSAWHRLGVTPLDKVTVPSGYFRWRVSKPGVGEFVSALASRKTLRFALDTALRAPDGMVWVPANTWQNMITFVGWVGPYALPPFYIDRYEVTNKQYQEFIDRGGYQKRDYWKEKFVEHGHELTWDEAMARFRDRTGRAAPSTWEGGHYPDGQADYPVSGVSWFEASAYAAFAGKTLPAFAQWYEAADPFNASYTVQLSNISRQHVARVGEFNGLGTFGTYDMAGNVREWVLNPLDADRRMILGGAWRAPTYLYAQPEALSPFDRSPENGVRCIRNLGPVPTNVAQAVTPLERDFTKVTPASDDAFRAYTVMYAYPKSPVNGRIESTEDGTDWRKEKVTFSAPYGDGRLTAYLFVPKRVRPPYQTIVFFPSARVVDIPNSSTLGDISFFDFVVQSGRAVLYPVYQDTYERRSEHSHPGATAIDIYVARAKEVRRSIDYLATRTDVDTSKLAYLGVSMGSAEGVIYAALAQDRLKTVVFLDGGYFLSKPPAGGDQADFAPRIRIPVLMVNGRYDFSFSLEKSQVPLFNALGTKAADKRHVVLETPHDVRAQRPALVRTVLDWLNNYLGRVGA